MHFSQPLWTADWAGLLIRIPLGAYFLLAGRIKMANIDAFVAEVKKYQVLPDQLSTLYAVMLPYLEILVGILLIIGLWTTLAGLIASCLLTSFIVALGIHPESPKLFNKDIILLGATLALLSCGAGLFSIDNFRNKS